MKKRTYALASVLTLIAILGGIALKLKKNKSIAEARVYRQDPTETPVLDADSTSFTSPANPDEIVFTGTFEPYRETKISAEAPGKITRITVDAGSVVSKAQTLVKLDDALLQLQLQAVDVQIEGLTADVNRYSILAKADAVQGIQLEKALLGLKAARVQRSTIQEQIDKTTIKAPFNGVVYAKLNEVGGYASPGGAILHLLDMSSVKFTINVAENDLANFQTGDTHQIIVDAFPDKEIVGKVTMIGSKANLGNNFPVQFIIPNFSNLALRAGMFGKVVLRSKN